MRRFWLAAYALLFALQVLAQNIPYTTTLANGVGPDSTSPPGYERRLFQMVDGLPENTVQALAQTPDHFLWIGTTGGLVRFDGASFKVFDRENTPEFHENSVFCMLTAHDGSLWIGMEGSGLVHLVNGRMRAYGVEDGLTDTFVRAIAQDQSGTIWIGTNNGLFQMRGPAAKIAPETPIIRRIDGTGAIPSIAVNAILEDTTGRLWLGGSQLIALQNGQPKAYRLGGEPSRNRVKSIAETADGTIWVGTVSGLNRLGRGSDTFQHVPNISGTVRVLRQTHDGTVWIGIVGRGGVAYRIDSHGELADPSPLPTDAVLSILEDTEHNVWVGTQAGMVRFSKTAATLILLPDTRDSDFGTVFLDRSGDLWAASTHLFRIRDGVPHPFVFPGLENVRVRNVFQDREGIFWVGTEGNGLYRVDSSGSHRFDTRNGLVNNFIRAIMQTSDGAIWIGTDEGVSRLLNGRFTSFRMKEGLAYISIRSMLEDAHQDVWIGTEQGLSHLHNDTFVNDAAVRALQREKIWAIHQDADGTLWFGTRNNGLFRYSEGRVTHISTGEGLPTGSVYQILEDRSGHLWLSGAVGVWLLNRRQLDDLADGHPTHLTTTFYSLANDLETVDLYGGMQSSGCISPGGEVWFPSNRGVIRIRQEAPDLKPSPPLIVTAAVADGQTTAADRPIDLSPGNHTLEIAYSPIMLQPQSDLRFRYKLDGVDKDWVNAGTRRTAYYTSLPPGTFHFHVVTFATNNPTALSEATAVVIQQPHFYRTWWFILCCLLSAVGIILGVHGFRVQQIHRHFAAVLEERRRLAGEMHDTLLQGCTSVSVVLDAVSSFDGAQDDGLKQHLIDCALSQIRTTIDEAREAVWQLRQPSPLTSNIGGMLRIMAQRIAEEFGVPVEARIADSPLDVPQEVAREVMMIAREAVHNAILHASPGGVVLCAEFGASGVIVTIVDDGCGFDSNSVFTNPGKHFGLVGMRERATRLGGTLVIHSSPGEGTKVMLSAPVQVVSSETRAI